MGTEFAPYAEYGDVKRFIASWRRERSRLLAERMPLPEKIFVTREMYDRLELYAEAFNDQVGSATMVAPFRLLGIPVEVRCD